MKQSDLIKLKDSLTLDQKIGQLVQLGGEFFNENTKTTQTGPSTKLGISKDYDIYNTGSALNVVDPDTLRSIQTNYLEKSTHKIPLVFMSDIIYGYKTVFPIPLAQGCSFDFDLLEKAASIVAEEAYHAGQQVTFSPMVDLVRDPRWGRVMESFGEDVYVGERYAKALVRGFQGDNDESKISPKKLAACVKHFAAYGAPVAGREYGAVDMSQQQLREVYLPSYKAAVDARVKLVMTAFNTLNGIPATGDAWLNRDILRGEFGFKGVLISDYAAIAELVDHGFAENDSEAAQIAIEAGVDVDMKTTIYSNNLKELVLSEQLDEALIDEAVLRILELKNDLGLFENPYRGLDDQANQTESIEKEKIGIELASKTTVLLKNNGVLPLQKNKKIAAVGPFVDNKAMVGMWAFTADRSSIVSLKEGLLAVFPDENLSFAEGSNALLDYSGIGFSDNIGNVAGLFEVKDQSTLINEAIDCSVNADLILMGIGETMFESGEGGAKTNIHLAQPQKDLIESMAALKKPMIAVVYAGRPLVLSDIEPYFDAIVYAWYPGTYGNRAVAQIIGGEINPSGRLAMTMPKDEGQIPIYYSTYSSGRPIKSESDNYRFTSRYINQTNAPQYAFGHGLSYSEFEYADLNVKNSKIKQMESLYLSFNLKNTSGVSGEEVVQLYLRDHVAKIVRPILELKHSERVFLDANESRKVSIELNPDVFSYLNNKGERIYEPGEFTVSIGSSSDNLKLSAIIELKA